MPGRYNVSYIFKQKICERCNLSFDDSLTDCPHCHNLSDDELELHKHKKGLAYENEGVFIPFLIFIFGTVFVIFLVGNYVLEVMS